MSMYDRQFSGFLSFRIRITQRLWRVLQEALGRDTSRPAQTIQKIDQLKPLLNILSSLLDVFSVGPSPSI